jgi:Protein of unknown function (DUF3071)
MHELRLVAVSEDGSYAVLAVPGRGGRFMLPIDDRLRTVARGQFSRLAQYEIEVESPLRPKEIQDRIRAGETADEIADAAGLPIERIRRFEGPVLAEREYRAQEAQRATVRSPGDSGPGPRLGDIVAERLAELGASADDARWDSRKRPDGNWQVQISFAAGGRTQVAEWIFDPRRRHIAPDDEQAARLCLPADELSALPASPHAMHAPATATVTPIAPRLGGLATHHPEQRAPSAPPVPAAAPGPATQPGRHAAGGQGSREADADRRPPERRPADGRPTERRAAERGPAERGPAERRPAERETAAAAEERGDQARERTARERPARKAAGGRSRRASVPSWDEIMFGSSRQPD